MTEKEKKISEGSKESIQEDVADILQKRLNHLSSCRQYRLEDDERGDGYDHLLDNLNTRISELIGVAELLNIELAPPEIRELSLLEKISAHSAILNRQF